MNTRWWTCSPFTTMWLACVVISLLLAACRPATVSSTLPPVPPTATMRPTQTPVQATQLSSDGSGEITLDLSGVAQDLTVETVAAVPASAGGPSWEIAPQHRRVTLQGYPVTDHLMQPQIFVYPVADLAEFNERAGQMATDLQVLLQARQLVDPMPFLPLVNDKQEIHPQVQYLDFKNGTGVRFLTQFNQGPVKINNVQLIYTCQGLTRDGRYYLAAVLPVTHPDLLATQQVYAQTEAELKDFPAYLTETVDWLDQQPGGSFTPDLAKLDALIQSIEVR